MNNFLIGLLLGLLVTIGIMVMTEAEHATELQLLADEYAANLAALDEAAESEKFCYNPYGSAVLPEYQAQQLCW